MEHGISDIPCKEEGVKAELAHRYILNTWGKHPSFLYCTFSVFGWFYRDGQEMDYTPGFCVKFRDCPIESMPSNIDGFPIVQRHPDWRPGVGSWFNRDKIDELIRNYHGG